MKRHVIPTRIIQNGSRNTLLSLSLHTICMEYSYWIPQSDEEEEMQKEKKKIFDSILRCTVKQNHVEQDINR